MQALPTVLLELDLADLCSMVVRLLGHSRAVDDEFEVSVICNGLTLLSDLIPCLEIISKAGDIFSTAKVVSATHNEH